jgi:hypothetical protein
MKISKTMTEKAVTADREGAKKSTGPTDTTHTKHNAVVHGLLAKHLKFDDPGDETRFASLTQDLEMDYRPVGTIERAILEEIAIDLWKLSLANGWEMTELNRQRRAARAIVTAFARNDDSETPLFATDDGSGSAAQLGWHCRELTIRSGKYHSDQEAELNCPSDKSSKRAQVLVEAKLSTAIDTIFRYEAMLKRDLYKAIFALHALQAKRLESEQDQWGHE